MKEIWKDIVGYEGVYQVSNFGRVKRVKTDRILKEFKNTDGYLLVHLYKNKVSSNQRIHRLVAQAFIPNTENKPQVNHIDENKTNNVVSNLEWVTSKENINHGTRNERMSKTQSIPILAINLKTGKSQEFYGTRECARQLELQPSNISAVLKEILKQTGGYTFKYINEGDNK